MKRLEKINSVLKNFEKPPKHRKTQRQSKTMTLDVRFSPIWSNKLENILKLQGPVRLCLFSAQILCTTASKLDVLQLCPQLQKRIGVLLDKTIDKLPVSSTPDSIEVRSDLAKALEPFLGMSAAWCPISVSREGSSSNSYKRGSGSHKAISMLSKFQATIDLAGAFGELFGKVERE